MHKPELPVVLALLLLGGCARSASLDGEVRLERGSGGAGPAPGITVRLVPESEPFRSEWQAAVAAFQAAAAPLVEQQRAADRLAEQARRAWDRAVATPGTSGVGLSQWNRSAAGRRWERELWGEVRRTSLLAAAARQRVQAVAARHAAAAESLLLRHATHETVSDETGQYILAQVPPGKAYVYARLQLPEREFIWFRIVEIGSGRHRLDLSERSAGGWPFAAS